MIERQVSAHMIDIDSGQGGRSRRRIICSNESSGSAGGRGAPGLV